jgi:hypothetical protein
MRPAVKTRETLMGFWSTPLSHPNLRRGATQLSGLYIGAIQWFSPIHSPDTTTTAIGAERWAAIDPSSLLLILSIQHIAYC